MWRNTQNKRFLIVNISYPEGGRRGYGREKRGGKKQLTKNQKKCKLGNSENSQGSSFQDTISVCKATILQ